ncbi:unnamed protein product [Cunninghamella blakesleeana]
MSNPSVKKQTKQFAPTIRGRGRGDRGVTAKSETTNDNDNDNSNSTDTPTTEASSSPATTDNKSASRLGSMRAESSEGRLQSIHGQKTRGGSAKMKFKPTIPAKRNKKEVTTTEESSKDNERGRDGFRGGFRGRGDGRGRGRGGGRGRGRGRGLIVEEVTASGIFSLGPSAVSSRARGGYAVSGGAFASYGGDSSSRHETENGSESDINILFANATDGFTPTVFPHVGRLDGDLDPTDLTSIKKKVPWLTIKSKEIKKEKDDDNNNNDDDKLKKIKTEIDDDDEQNKLLKDVKKEKDDNELNLMNIDNNEKDKSTEVKNEVEDNTQQILHNQESWTMYEDAPAQNIFAVNEHNKVVSVADDELLFFQLPTVVPRFELPKSEEDKEDENMEDTDKTEGEKDNKTDDKGKSKLPPSAQKVTLEEQMNTMNLEDMPDGKIGKIIIYKSGKMKLKIGNVLLDVEQGMRSSFLENVMVIDSKNETSKKAVELGHIVQKFTCAPNMDALLKGCEENYFDDGDDDE